MPEQPEQPNNAVLEVKLDYIQKAVTVIQSDVKEIKNDYISRREHDTAIKDLQTNYNAKILAISDKLTFYSRVMWLIGALVATALGQGILKLIIKQ